VRLISYNVVIIFSLYVIGKMEIAIKGEQSSQRKAGVKNGVGLYISRQATHPLRYVLEQILYLFLGWVPTIVGIGLRGIFYRLILKMHGWAAIEDGVRLRQANLIRLNHGVYLDHGTYLPAPAASRLGRTRL
jgi:hypothetical protein